MVQARCVAVDLRVALCVVVQIFMLSLAITLSAGEKKPSDVFAVSSSQPAAARLGLSLQLSGRGM
jgi:hypothetical protein